MAATANWQKWQTGTEFKFCLVMFKQSHPFMFELKITFSLKILAIVILSQSCSQNTWWTPGHGLMKVSKRNHWKYFNWLTVAVSPTQDGHHNWLNSKMAPTQLTLYEGKIWFGCSWEPSPTLTLSTNFSIPKTLARHLILLNLQKNFGDCSLGGHCCGLVILRLSVISVPF